MGNINDAHNFEQKKRTFDPNDDLFDNPGSYLLICGVFGVLYNIFIIIPTLPVAWNIFNAFTINETVTMGSLGIILGMVTAPMQIVIGLVGVLWRNKRNKMTALIVMGCVLLLLVITGLAMLLLSGERMDVLSVLLEIVPTALFIVLFSKKKRGYNRAK